MLVTCATACPLGQDCAFLQHRRKEARQDLAHADFGAGSMQGTYSPCLGPPALVPCPAFSLYLTAIDRPLLHQVCLITFSLSLL